ncbi:unnamed protein product, partial [Mesorhabditis spiculigera]
MLIDEDAFAEYAADNKPLLEKELQFFREKIDEAKLIVPIDEKAEAKILDNAMKEIKNAIHTAIIAREKLIPAKSPAPEKQEINEPVFSDTKGNVKELLSDPRYERKSTLPEPTTNPNVADTPDKLLHCEESLRKREVSNGDAERVATGAPAEKRTRAAYGEEQDLVEPHQGDDPEVLPDSRNLVLRSEPTRGTTVNHQILIIENEQQPLPASGNGMEWTNDDTGCYKAENALVRDSFDTNSLNAHSEKCFSVEEVSIVDSDSSKAAEKLGQCTQADLANALAEFSEDRQEQTDYEISALSCALAFSDSAYQTQHYEDANHYEARPDFAQGTLYSETPQLAETISKPAGVSQEIPHLERRLLTVNISTEVQPETIRSFAVDVEKTGRNAATQQKHAVSVHFQETEKSGELGFVLSKFAEESIPDRLVGNDPEQQETDGQQEVASESVAIHGENAMENETLRDCYSISMGMDVMHGFSHHTEIHEDDRDPQERIAVTAHLSPIVTSVSGLRIDGEKCNDPLAVNIASYQRLSEEPPALPRVDLPPFNEKQPLESITDVDSNDFKVRRLEITDAVEGKAKQTVDRPVKKTWRREDFIKSAPLEEAAGASELQRHPPTGSDNPRSTYSDSNPPNLAMNPENDPITIAEPGIAERPEDQTHGQQHDDVFSEEPLTRGPHAGSVQGCYSMQLASSGREPTSSDIECGPIKDDYDISAAPALCLTVANINAVPSRSSFFQKPEYVQDSSCEPPTDNRIPTLRRNTRLGHSTPTMAEKQEITESSLDETTSNKLFDNVLVKENRQIEKEKGPRPELPMVPVEKPQSPAYRAPHPVPIDNTKKRNSVQIPDPGYERRDAQLHETQKSEDKDDFVCNASTQPLNVLSQATLHHNNTKFVDGNANSNSTRSEHENIYVATSQLSPDPHMPVSQPGAEFDVDTTVSRNRPFRKRVDDEHDYMEGNTDAHVRSASHDSAHSSETTPDQRVLKDSAASEKQMPCAQTLPGHWGGVTPAYTEARSTQVSGKLVYLHQYKSVTQRTTIYSNAEPAPSFIPASKVASQLQTEVRQDMNSLGFHNDVSSSGLTARQSKKVLTTKTVLDWANRKDSPGALLTLTPSKTKIGSRADEVIGDDRAFDSTTNHTIAVAGASQREKRLQSNGRLAAIEQSDEILMLQKGELSTEAWKVQLHMAQAETIKLKQELERRSKSMEQIETDMKWFNIDRDRCTKRFHDDHCFLSPMRREQLRLDLREAINCSSRGHKYAQESATHRRQAAARAYFDATGNDNLDQHVDIVSGIGSGPPNADNILEVFYNYTDDVQSLQTYCRQHQLGFQDEHSFLRHFELYCRWEFEQHKGEPLYLPHRNSAHENITRVCLRQGSLRKPETFIYYRGEIDFFISNYPEKWPLVNTIESTLAYMAFFHDALARHTKNPGKFWKKLQNASMAMWEVKAEAMGDITTPRAALKKEECNAYATDMLNYSDLHERGFAKGLRNMDFIN